jgi:archaellin
MKRPAVALEILAFVLMAIIAVSSVAALALVASNASSTTSSQQTSVVSSTSTSAENGLRLSLSAGPSETTSGGAIVVGVSDFNTLDSVNAPPIVGAPAIGSATLSLGPCSQLPLGFAIYEGDYEMNNISGASSLNLYQPGFYSCPAEFAVAYFSFSPLSGNVTLYSPQPSGSGSSTVPTAMWTAPDAFNQSFTGYWTGGTGVLQSGTFHAFPLGVYTLVGGDDYGQLTLVHFVLTAQTTVTSTTGQSSSSVSTTAAPPGGQNASSNSQYGLKLLVNMNATEIGPGQSVQVSLSEFNTLPRVNNATASGDYEVDVALGSCRNEYDQPFGIAVYAGHVDAQNVSQGQQVNIFPITACPMYIRLVTGYEFQPQSDLAVILPSYGATPSPLVGSVVISATYSSQTTPLSPGTYTVVAADEWGALAFLYFQVK